MATTTWLSRLARHAAPRAAALEAEKRRTLFQTEAEKVALAAGAEADEEAQKLRRELVAEIARSEKELEEARNYSAHLANRLLFEQAKADAWKAAAEAWSWSAQGWRIAENTGNDRVAAQAVGREITAREAQERAERTERVQARRSPPGDGESRSPNGRQGERELSTQPKPDDLDLLPRGPEVRPSTNPHSKDRGESR